MHTYILCLNYILNLMPEKQYHDTRAILMGRWLSKKLDDYTNRLRRDLTHEQIKMLDKFSSMLFVSIECSDNPCLAYNSVRHLITQSLKRAKDKETI